MSGTSNGSVTPRASAKPRFSVLVKDLFEVLQRLSVYQKELMNVDRLFDEKKQLEEEVKSLTTTLTMKDQEIARLNIAKDAEVAKVEAQKDVIHKEYEKRFLAWHTGTTKQTELEAKVVELKIQLGEARKLVESSGREAASLKDQLTKSKMLVQVKDDDLENMNTTQEKMDLELTGARSKLESLQRDQKALGLTELSPKTLGSELTVFAAKCHGLAIHFFLTQLPKEVTHDELCKKLKQCGFVDLAPQRTVISDSVQSQYLRMAAAQKIIANELYIAIFKQYYLPESTADRKLMDDVLLRLEKGNFYEEAVFRLRLLSAYKIEEADYIKTAVRLAVAEVTRLLDPLLTPPARKNFQSELEKLFKEAVKLWQPTQKSRTKIRADNKPNEDWELYEEHDSAIDLNEEHEAVRDVQEAVPTDALFPRVYFGSEVIFEGYALWAHQRTVIAAGIELSKNRSQPVRRRTNSSSHGATSQEDSRGRRPNLSSTATAAGRQGDSPTSPKSSVRSFTDHVNIRKTTKS